jgi:hypothetical protein
MTNIYPWNFNSNAKAEIVVEKRYWKNPLILELKFTKGPEAMSFLALWTAYITVGVMGRDAVQQILSIM